MTIYEMRCIYPGYARKERELEELDRIWTPRIIQQIVDKAARDGIKDEPDSSCELGPVLGPVTERSDTDAREEA